MTVPWNEPHDWITISDMPKIVGAPQAFYLIAIVFKFCTFRYYILVFVTVIICWLAHLYRQECQTANVK